MKYRNLDQATTSENGVYPRQTKKTREKKTLKKRLLLLVVLALLGFLLYYWYYYYQNPNLPKVQKKKSRYFTEEELSLYDGTDSEKPIYLSIMGRVYDVTEGKKYYAPGASYHFFAGKDATRSFLTGCFDMECFKKQPKGLDGLEPKEIDGIKSWVKDYDQKYKFVGYLKGYHKTARKTPEKKSE